MFNNYKNINHTFRLISLYKYAKYIVHWGIQQSIYYMFGVSTAITKIKTTSKLFYNKM